MTYTTIEEYNTYLVENQININIIEYVKEVNKLKFKINISFIDDFIELVSKNECCIHHDMLQIYGIISLNKGTTDIKRLLEQNDFIENEDFKLRNVAEFNSKGGRGNKNEYYLHPEAFKICLIRSLKTKIYAKYYLLLEKCIKYFNDYEDKLKEKYIIKLKEKIIKKNNKIDHLEEKLNTIIEYNKKTQIMNEELLKSNKLMEKSLNKTNYKLDETLEKLDEVHEELETTNTELEDTNEKLDNTDKTLIQVAKKSSILEYFIIMYNNNTEYKYYIIRGQKRYINKKIDQLEGYTKIKTIECVPNANILWNLMKQELKDKIDFCGNKLNLLEINKSEFLVKVDKIYNKRKNVIL